MVQQSAKGKPTSFYGTVISGVPWILLLASMLLSVLAWWQQEQIVNNNERASFERDLTLTRNAVVVRLTDYADILRSGYSLFQSNPDITRTEWGIFVNSLAVTERYPGMTGMGFVAYVPQNQLNNFVETQRAGYPAYNYRPAGERSDYFLVQYTEPMELTSSVLGFDMGSDSTRRQPMEQARDSGKLVITGRLNLIQDSVVRPSIIMSMPVYRPNAPHATVEERRQNIWGWINASFRINELVSGIFNEKNPAYDFEIYDGTTLSPENLLYDSEPNPPAAYTQHFVGTSQIEFGNHIWTIRFTTLPAFDKDSARPFGLLVLVGGLLASGLLFFFTRNLVNERTRSLRLAERNITQLQEANQFADQIITKMGQGLIILNEGIFEYVNPAYAKLLGYTEQELIGRHHDDFIAPEDLEIIYKHRAARLEGESTTYEVQLIHKNGDPLNVLITGAPRYKEGKVVGSIAVITNLTERKQVEEKIQIQNEYLAALHDTTLALINQLDLTELLQTIIIRSGGLLGTSHGSVCLLEPDGKRMKRAVTVGFAPDLIAEYLEPGQGFVGHIWNTGQPAFISDYQKWINRISDIDQESFPVRSTVGVPLKSGEKVIGVLSLVYFKEVNNIGENELLLLSRFAQLTSLALLNAQLYTAAQNELTERKRTEIALAQTRDEALEASRLKSEFVATMSHEIRTPLNAVLGMTELLLESELNDEQREYATIAINSAQSLLNLINDILDFSKIEANKLAIEERNFDLLYLIDSVSEVFAVRLHEKRLTLTTWIDQAVPRHLKGDSFRLRQILLNLVSNAVKFTEQGEIVVRVQLQNWLEQKALIRFEVSDSGIGLSEVARKRLFQPFTQADGSMTRKYGGTGLGLSISKNLVSLMGGEIGVESVEGKGSTFWFQLPLEAVIPAEANLQTTSQEYRVLVVEENLSYREILLSYLETWGMSTQAVHSGTEAIHKLRAAALAHQPFNIAIIDLNVSDMDGFALARTIQQDINLANVRLILLTSFDHKRQSQQARQAGFVDYLTKPVRQSQLYDSIMNVMDSAESSPPKLLERNSGWAGFRPDSEATGIKGKILVAEDNPINQEMALRQLQKLGYKVTLVINGAAAVEAVGQADFDLILMDCQMPVMDGFEATAQIRQLPKERIPIVAMTANAMQGDREACLAAGMDDYLPKPVNLHQLEQKLAHWLAKNKTAPEQTQVEEPQNPPVVLDTKILQGIKELQGDDESDLLAELIDIYFREAPKQVAEIRKAWQEKNAVLLRRAAHTLKSSSLNLGAKQIGEWCKELEQAGRAEIFEGVPEKLALLEAELPRVYTALDLERQKGLV